MNDEKQLYWGDFHTHFTPDFDQNKKQLISGKQNIDFCSVLFYPFEWKWKKGLKMETTGNLPGFDEIWEGLKELSREHNDPGEFVTFLGYEWNGNRTYYGDHNVIYYSDDNPLDDSWDLPDLYENLRDRKAVAIPHHTAYYPGNRGKMWDYMDEDISPVMEIYSGHGSSEGCDTPARMTQNPNMGPRTRGGSFQDALERGIEIGVIGSNDGDGLPGRWGQGRTGVWASELSRRGIWQAIQRRRTYAVTGDRIQLDFAANGNPMGTSFGSEENEITIQGQVTGSRDIEKIELVGKEGVLATYEPGPVSFSASNRFKLKLEMGWGPNENYGFKELQPIEWNGRLKLKNGRIKGIENCFYGVGQEIVQRNEQAMEFTIKTLPARQQKQLTEGFILEFEGSPETILKGKIDGVELDVPIKELSRGGKLIPMVEESEKRIHKTFDITPEEVINPDVYFHNARKIKLHRISGEKQYKTGFSFTGIKLRPGKNWFYVRVRQVNGQKAWSSPIWVNKEG